MTARSHDITELIDFSERPDGSLEVVPRSWQPSGMATRKRKFWNEGGIPELGENPPPKAPIKPLPETVTPSHSTGTHRPPDEKPQPPPALPDRK